MPILWKDFSAYARSILGFYREAQHLSPADWHRLGYPLIAESVEYGAIWRRWR